MSDPIAEVIIPTFAHPRLLPFSLASVRRQTIENIRIHVVGDGTCDETRALVRDAMTMDPRIVFHDHPKSARTGEEYRHPIVTESRAEIVTYLGDDDLMAPDHVELMLATLKSADVAFPPHTHISPEGETHFQTYSLEHEYWREVALSGTSLFSLTGMSHTVAYYRSLLKGWESTPQGFYTDQFMIQKFIRNPATRFGLAPVPTVVHFPTSQRQHMTSDERIEELDSVAKRLSSVADWTTYRTHFSGELIRRSNHFEMELIVRTQQYELTNAALQQEIERSAALQQQLDSVESARVIRLRNRVLRFRLVKWLARDRP